MKRRSTSEEDLSPESAHSDLSSIDICQFSLQKLQSSNAHDQISALALLSSLDLASSPGLARNLLTREFGAVLFKLISTVTLESIEVASEAASVVKCWLAGSHDAGVNASGNLVNRLYAMCLLPAVLEGLVQVPSIIIQDTKNSQIYGYLESLFVIIWSVCEVVPAAVVQINRTRGFLETVISVLSHAFENLNVEESSCHMMALANCLATVTDDNTDFPRDERLCAILSRFVFDGQPQVYLPIMAAAIFNLSATHDLRASLTKRLLVLLAGLSFEGDQQQFIISFSNGAFQTLTNLSLLEEESEADPLRISDFITTILQCCLAISQITNEEDFDEQLQEALCNGNQCIANVILSEIDPEYPVEQVWAYCTLQIQSARPSIVSSIISLMRAIALSYSVMEIDERMAGILVKVIEQANHQCPDALETAGQACMVLSTVSPDSPELFVQVALFLMELIATLGSTSIMHSAIESLARMLDNGADALQQAFMGQRQPSLAANFLGNLKTVAMDERIECSHLASGLLEFFQSATPASNCPSR